MASAPVAEPQSCYRLMYPPLFPQPNYVLRDPTEEEMRKIHSFFPDHSVNCARWMKRQGIIERNLRFAPDFAVEAVVWEERVYLAHLFFSRIA